MTPVLVILTVLAVAFVAYQGYQAFVVAGTTDDKKENWQKIQERDPLDEWIIRPHAPGERLFHLVHGIPVREGFHRRNGVIIRCWTKDVSPGDPVKEEVQQNRNI